MTLKGIGLLLASSGTVVACSLTAGVAEPVAAPVVSAVPLQGSTQSVTKFWSVTCAKCHGEEGQGGGAGTGTLLTRELYGQEHDRDFFDAIKNGHPENGMPSYGATMSDEEIWAQVVHIRELQARAVGDKAPPESGGVYKGERASFRVEPVVTGGLEVPWALDWLSDGRMLVTEKKGSLRILGKDGKLSAPIEGVPESRPIGQGGMMEVAVHPTNGFIYLSFTDPAEKDDRAGLTKIVRGKLSADGTRWTTDRTIWEAPQSFYTRAGIHFGSRIAFDGKGHVFFSVGERGGNEKSLDPKIPWGKIYRVNEDGSVPGDNPFVGTPDAFKGIWTLGHRNPQGLAFGLDGKLWDTEHAPRGGDEVNDITKGANYGWPIVGYGINYNDTPFHTPFPELSAPGRDIELPVFRWLPSTGACGLDVARGAAFPAWRGDLLAGGLAGQNVDRIRIKDGKMVERETLVRGMGRVRDVAVAPSGEVYVVLNGPDTIVKLVPAK